MCDLGLKKTEKPFIDLIFDWGEVVEDDAAWRKALLVALAGN